MSFQTPLKLIRQPLKSIGWQSTLEQEQAVLRIFISVVFIVYLMLTRPTALHPNSGSWLFAIQYVEFFLAYALAVFISTLWSPSLSVIRRLFTIVADIGLLSYGLYESSSVGAPWYGVYLWITLGNGFRYGEKYLYVSGAASLAGFITVTLLTPYWIQHQPLAIGLAVTLLVIPVYSARLIRRLNEARYQADMANQAKSRFLSRMSHEIRTPLNGVLGMTELLKNLPLDKQARHYVHIIETSGQALNRQINEILDLSKIEAEQLPIEHIDFDLYILVAQTLQMFDEQAAQQSVKLREQLDPRTPFMLKGDPYRLQQIIINLVGNAIKFTHQGTVTLRVSPECIADTQVALRFEIVDTGIGMEQDALNSIFEPFRQADASITRKFGGTGLGTTICKALVELMGGRIGVHSLPGSGTTFWFSLSFARSENLSEDHGNWKWHCRTLYIRNHEQRENRIPELLNQWRVPFQQTTNLGTARKLMENNGSDGGWDAIIVDARTHDNELNALLRDCDTLDHCPAPILIDANESPAQLGNALHASYVKHSADTVHIASARKPQRTDTGDRRRLNILVSDDNHINRLVVEKMLQQLDHHCDVVEGGKAALNALYDRAYDAVLIDKNMPDMGGIEVFKAYHREHAGKSSVPFILLTADATEESRLQAKAAGIHYFLAKPLSINSLEEVLGNISGEAGVSFKHRRHVDKESTASNAPLKSSARVFNPVIFRELVSISGDSQHFARELIENFKRDAMSNVAGMENAVHDNNPEGFRDFAHALKGSASYVGLIRLEEICKHNENINTDVFKQDSLSILRQLKNEVKEGIKSLEAQWHDGRQAS